MITKTLQLQGGGVRSPDPSPGALPLDPAGGSDSDPRYRLAPPRSPCPPSQLLDPPMAGAEIGPATLCRASES